MFSIVISILLLLPVTHRETAANIALIIQHNMLQTRGIHPSVPEDAINVLKEFHQAIVNNDVENAKRLYYEGKIGWSNIDPIYLDFRILTFGPVLPPLIEFHNYPKPTESDYVAWVEVTMNNVQWNFPHTHYHTILTRRTGEWKVLCSEIIQPYADPKLVHIPSYHYSEQKSDSKIIYP